MLHTYRKQKGVCNMAVDFNKSKTKENLMRAFAGESQARNRYTIAAETAREKNMFAINQVFLFTADQERAHAERFYALLQPFSGTTIAIDGAYPVDHYDSVVQLLRAAQHNEMEEATDVYPAFGDVARAEGFPEISATFYEIAEIERIHSKRFGKLASLLESNQYFECVTGRNWMCLNCGYIFCGRKLPEVCPACLHDKGYFIPAELAPFLECDFLKGK